MNIEWAEQTKARDEGGEFGTQGRYHVPLRWQTNIYNILKILIHTFDK